ncbi:MAG: GNAT family N-acetyltransferase, partial [Brachybacterium sp.]|nr:GNAT family N-acetyltransferase [Brachybacterium sp.]
MTSQRTHETQHGTEFTLRPATDGDVPELVDLVQSAYRREGGWTTEVHLVAGHRTDAAELRA